MTELEGLIRVLQVLTALIVVVGFVGPPMVFFWLRKHVRDREDTVTPLHMEERLRTYTQERDALLDRMRADRDKEIARISFDIREAFNTSVGRVESGEIQRHSELKAQVDDVRQGIREAFRASRDAMDHAVKAEHQADRAELQINGMKELIDSRLKHIEDLCEDRFPKKGGS